MSIPYFIKENSLIVLLLCVCLLCVNAQSQTLFSSKKQLLLKEGSRIFLLPRDTIKKNNQGASNTRKKISQHNPKLATILSAALPGAGQIYNQKYWKAPIVWAGIGVCGYFIRNNHLLYSDYKNALLQRADTSIKEPDKYLGVYSSDQLLKLQDQYRQNRDLFIIVTSLVYVLNVVDALVDAHLFSFDVSDDLSLHWQPYFNSTVYSGNHAGLSMQVKLR